MTIVFLLLFWTLFGAIGYKMAEKRGRSPWLGFTMTFLFGIFAIIVYWMIGKTDAKKRQDIREEEELRQAVRNNN